MWTPLSASRRALATLSVCACAVGALGVGGGRLTSAQEAAFEEAIEVHLVNVEVFVTDKEGNPITGLAEKEFQIIEDGKKVEITHFVELRPEAAAGQVERLGDTDAAVGSTTTPSYLVLFLDDFAFQPQERRRLIDDMRKYVERAPETLQIAVASYDSNLRIHQPFTADRALIRAAIDRLGEFNPRSTARYAEREAAFRAALETLRSIRDGVAQIAEPGGPTIDDSGQQLTVATREIEAHAQEMRAENRRALFELSQLVNALGSLPGRKAVVHVSQGMPIRPWEELFQALNDSFQEIRAESDVPMTREEREADLDLRSSALGALESSVSGRGGGDRGTGMATDIHELTALANASRVSFYTIRPFTQSGGFPAEFAGSISSFYTASMSSIREANLRETAQTLAEATGGVSLAGGDLNQILDRAERDFRGYYSLAYRPEPGRPPGFHDVKVKLKGRGRVIRYRKGFFEKPPEARFGDRASAALLLERDDNPLGLEIDLADITPEGTDGQRSATLIVIVPLERVTLTPEEPGRWTVHAELYLAASDPFGGTAPVQLVELQIPVEAASEAEARNDRYGARMKIVTGAGERRIAVGVIDRASGLESYVARTFEVP